ncbi:MAG TPA: hypothetical protein VK464_10660, partial [Symbiobacteriaceae bacterium]|nr:hypothetical protein [Symbiobacteriaceae bacterium]
MDGTLSRRLGAAMMAVLITAAAAGCAGRAPNRTNITTPGTTTAPNVGANLLPGVTGAGMAGAPAPATGSAAGYGGGMGNRLVRAHGEMDLGRQISTYVASLDLVSGGGLAGGGPAMGAGGGGTAAGAGMTTGAGGGGTAAGAGMTTGAGGG